MSTKGIFDQFQFKATDHNQYSCSGHARSFKYLVLSLPWLYYVKLTRLPDQLAIGLQSNRVFGKRYLYSCRHSDRTSLIKEVLSDRRNSA